MKYQPEKKEWKEKTKTIKTSKIPGTEKTKATITTKILKRTYMTTTTTLIFTRKIPKRIVSLLTKKAIKLSNILSTKEQNE